MVLVKKIISSYKIIFITFLVLLSFVTFLSYFNLISNNMLKNIKFIIPILSIALGAFKIGRKSQKHGYLKGLYLGLSFIFIFFIINLIFYHSFNLKLIIYYLIILLVSILFSMLGIKK